MGYGPGNIEGGSRDGLRERTRTVRQGDGGGYGVGGLFPFPDCTSHPIGLRFVGQGSLQTVGYEIPTMVRANT